MSWRPMRSGGRLTTRCPAPVTGVRRPRWAREIANAMGHELSEGGTGGGSDGNLTAALGVPTLDGLGAVGEGAHAANESILVDRIADRTTLIAKLLATV